MDKELAVIVYGLLSAASWGAGDFSGGFATKRSSVFGVVIGGQIVGFLLFLALGLLNHEQIPGLANVIFSAIAGLVGMTGLLMFYRGLATGRMGIVAPMAAVVTAVVPVLVSLFTQGLPSTLTLIGFGLGLIGVWFLSQSGQLGSGLNGIGLALLAGVGFGGFLVIINQAAAEHFVFLPLAIARFTSITALLIITQVRHIAWRPAGNQLSIIALSGILDAGGNAFFVLASQAGRLDIASVLSSMYPATTVLLAAILLRERVNGVQLFGILIVLVAIACITIGSGG